ncbi:MAG: CFI-box-CTERM domain-containing protein [Polyangia bacterium]
MALRLAVVLCALGLCQVARAQSGGSGGGGGGTTAGGNCTGMMTGNMGLAVPQANGGFLTIPSSQVTSGVFGRAECDCASASGNPDINLEIKLTSPFPASTAGIPEIWVGDSSCTNATTRTSSSNTTCQKIASPSVIDFTVNSSATSGSGLHYALKADALSNPNPQDPTKHVCDPAQGALTTPSNSVYLFIYTDPNMPLATCTLTLSEKLSGPDAVTNTTASGGDSAVTLSWTAPGPGVNAPSFFQVLCADDCGNPVFDSPSASQIYSTCENGSLSRRDLTSGGSSVGGGTDGGTTVSTDMALMSLRTDVGGRLPWQPNVAACPADMGTPDGGGLFPPGSGGPLASLDPRYICSAQISPSTTSKRIDGLTNGQTYHFYVLSVDAFGNATPSERIDGTAQPTEDLWRRYRDAGGGPGGCFIATAAFGSYENRWVWVLRDFRDQVLLEHGVGRSFVEWYYAHSPRAAAWIAAHGWARAITRVALVPVIAVAWFWLYVPPWQQAIVVLLLCAFFWRKRLRAALRRHHGESAT